MGAGGLYCIYCISCRILRPLHEVLQQFLQLCCPITEFIPLADVTGEGHIFVGGTGYIHLDLASVVHGVILFTVVGKAVSPEQNVQTFLAGTELRVGVHQLHNAGGRFREVSAVGDTVIQINGTEAIENAEADTGISRCCVRYRKGSKGSGIVAFRKLPGVGIIRDFGLPSVPLLISPAAESAAVYELFGNIFCVYHSIDLRK